MKPACGQQAIEPLFSVPIIGSRAGLVAWTDDTFVGADYRRPEWLAVYNPAQELVYGIPTAHPCQITAVTVLSSYLANPNSQRLGKRTSCLATGDTQGRVVITDWLGQTQFIWEPSEVFGQAPVKQLVTGPGADQLTVLYHQEGARWLTILSPGQDEQSTVRTLADQQEHYAAISKGGQLVAVRHEPLSEDGKIDLTGSWLGIERDNRRLPYQIPAGTWLDDKLSRSFCFTQDGQYLITAGGDEGSGLTCWDINSGETVWRSGFVLDSKGGRRIVAVSCSPDGRRLAVLDSWVEGGFRSHLTLMSARDGRIEARIALKELAPGLTFSLDNRLVAFLHPYQQLIVCSVEQLVEQTAASEVPYLLLPGERS